MTTIKRTAAVAEVLLIFPAVLFMASLFVRGIQPHQFEPAHTAMRIVDWYASQHHIGLWLLLIAMPLTALITGCALLPRAWQSNGELRRAARQTFAIVQTHIATLFVAVATVTAFGILAIVALHMMTD
jgi:di/tricarboxylate transporter